MSANFRNPETLHRPFGYTHVVEVTAGRPVYISGQVALDREGELVGPGDIRAQARQVLENLKAALEAVGASFDQVVKLNVYLLDITQLPAVRELRDVVTRNAHPPGQQRQRCSRRSPPPAAHWAGKGARASPLPPCMAHGG